MKKTTTVKPAYFFACLWVCFFQAVQVHAQVYGCKDTAASNYNASATINDGSCQYKQSFYTPPVKVSPLSPALAETSGLQWANNALWSFNDGGNSATLFKVDTTTGAILQTITLEGAGNVDWEDIAFDGINFYIGDFGNNATGARTDLKIYTFPASAIPDHSSMPSVTIPAAQVGVISFTYADQPQPPVPVSGNNTAFDCEAMIVDGGKIHLFSKNWINASTTHYVIDGITAGNYVATAVETLATNYLVTAADKVPGTNAVMLLGYQNSGAGYHFLHWLTDFHDGLYFNGNVRRLDLPTAAEMGQAEGLSFLSPTYGYISNERFERTLFGFTITVEQKLRSFNVAEFASSGVLQSSLQLFTVKPKDNVHEVQWRFSAPVQDLVLQHSRNGINFFEVKTFATGTTGSFLYQPSAGKNCYRLTWKTAGGHQQQSAVSCLSANVTGRLVTPVLSATGQLQFVQNSSPALYQFRLLSTDGRLMAQTAKQMISTGHNTIRFPVSLQQNHILLLQMLGDDGNESKLLRVQ